MNKSEIKDQSPSNLLKNGIDSIVFFFDNKNKEYLKNISESQIIINNLEKRLKNLTKENYILKKSNTRQAKLINELRNENIDLKNIINNIKGKLNINSQIFQKVNNNNINNNKIQINKLNINNFGNNNRTRNITNMTAHMSSSSNNDICLTDRDRYHRKNNVLGYNLKEKEKRERSYFSKILEKDSSFSDYLIKFKDNYYSRQRSKNNSFSQNFIKNDNNSYEKKNIKTDRKKIFNKINFNQYKNTEVLNNINNPKKYIVDYNNNINERYQTLDNNSYDRSQYLTSNNFNKDKSKLLSYRGKNTNDCDYIEFGKLNGINKKNTKNLLINNFLANCKNALDYEIYQEIFQIFQGNNRNKILILEEINQKIYYLLNGNKELIKEFDNIREFYK